MAAPLMGRTLGMLLGHLQGTGRVGGFQRRVALPKRPTALLFRSHPLGFVELEAQRGAMIWPKSHSMVG